jgi:hypothetical protein
VRRRGQALIETCLVVAVVSLVFFGAFEVSRLLAAREVLWYAASRGVRADIVGFNRFMVFKTVRVGAIPNAGLLLTPPHDGGPLAQYALERPRIPLYLGAGNSGELPAILDYADWDRLDIPDAATGPLGGTRMEVSQDVPLTLPMHRAFYAADGVTLSAASDLEDHARLYLNDEGW